jgi:hypothetical protein
VKSCSISINSNKESRSLKSNNMRKRSRRKSIRLQRKEELKFFRAIREKMKLLR